MEYLKLASVVLGAHGVWKLIETLLQYRTQKIFKKAEIHNLNVQTNDVIISNMMRWQEKMEARINELEKNNKEMQEVITKQRDRINELKQYIDQLEGELRNYQKQHK